MDHVGTLRRFGGSSLSHLQLLGVKMNETPGGRAMRARGRRYSRGVKEEFLGRPLWQWLLLVACAVGSNFLPYLM
jgi:hypothetical protein